LFDDVDLLKKKISHLGAENVLDVWVCVFFLMLFVSSFEFTL